MDGLAPMRPVKPIDLEEGIVAAFPIEDAPAVPADDLVMMVDPTTCKFMFRADPVRAAFAAEIRAVFDRIAARGEQAVGQVAQTAAEMRGVALELGTIVTEARLIAGEMRALMYLFDNAIGADDAPDAPLTDASRIVSSCVRSMAARIDALDDRATAVSAPLYGRAS